MFNSATVRQQQALPRDDALESLTTRNRYLEERLQALENLKEPFSRASVGDCIGCNLTSSHEHLFLTSFIQILEKN